MFSKFTPGKGPQGPPTDRNNITLSIGMEDGPFLPRKVLQSPQNPLRFIFLKFIAFLNAIDKAFCLPIHLVSFEQKQNPKTLLWLPKQSVSVQYKSAIALLMRIWF